MVPDTTQLERATDQRQAAESLARRLFLRLQAEQQLTDREVDAARELVALPGQALEELPLGRVPWGERLLPGSAPLPSAERGKGARARIHTLFLPQAAAIFLTLRPHWRTTCAAVAAAAAGRAAPCAAHGCCVRPTSG